MPDAIETTAQVLAARFVARSPIEPTPAQFIEIDVASLELIQTRTVGVEQVGLYALAKLQFDSLLQSLGITVRFKQKDGRTLHVRNKTTQPEPQLKSIYEVLGADHLPGGTKKRVDWLHAFEKRRSSAIRGFYNVKPMVYRSFRLLVKLGVTQK